jgi:hypothetical protein
LGIDYLTDAMPMWRIVTSMPKRLLKIQHLSDASGIAVRTLRTLTHQRKIPCIRAGHRTVFYDLEAVLAALGKFERRAVS